MRAETKLSSRSLDETIKRMRRASLNAASPFSLQKMCDHATAMVEVWEYETYQYVFVSNAVTYVTGYEPKDWFRLGVKNIQSIIHPDDREKIIRESEKNRKAAAQFRPGMDDSKPFSTVEFRLRRKDGSYVWMHSDSSVFSRTPEGRMKYIVSTSVNIDAQKAYEAKLRETAQQLKESRARLQEEYEQLLTIDNAKDELVSITSHQLRTPATGVKQYLGLMLQNYVGEITDDQRQVLQVANEFNDRQIKIVEELLTIAKMDAGKVQLHKSDTDIISLVSGVVEEQRSKGITRNQNLSFSHEGLHMCAVYMDALLIRMVLENMVDNARKYSPDGTGIHISVHADKNFATVEVKDQGVGIAKKDQAKLFKKFSRIQNDQTSKISGTGLGLYWAKQIVDLHGGDLYLVSSSEAGSTFALSLPLLHKSM